MNSDFEIFNSYLNSINFNFSNNSLLELELIQTNRTNNSLYRFREDSQINTKLISYNDHNIKDTYMYNPMVNQLLENPLYILMFTNSHFNYSKQINEIFDLIDLYKENIKILLKNNQIMNLTTKQVFTLSQQELNELCQKLGCTSFSTVIDNLYNNNLYCYNIISAFFGIKINYWRILPGNPKVEYVPFRALEMLLNKMMITNASEFNLMELFYKNQSDQVTFTSYYLTFSIPDDVKKYYTACK